MPAHHTRQRLLDLVAAHQLSHDFPAAVVDAAAEAAQFAVDDLEDLTSLPFVTIDYPDSTDLDQALFIERRGPGYRIHYALADASAFVPTSGPLFEEALARGTSYYLPDLMVPMLPRVLCEDAVSLGPNVERRAFVFAMDLDQTGNSVTTRVCRAKIRSRAKLNYAGVDAWLRGQPSDNDGGYGGAEFEDSLRLLAEVGQARIDLAVARHVVRFDRRSTRMHVDPATGAIELEVSHRNAVQRYNEQISLLCNIEGARLLGDRGLFRLHDPPTDAELARFAALTEAVADHHGLEPSWRWHHDGDQALATYIDALPDEGPNLGIARALQRQAMILGKPSYFADAPGPHYGIGAECYARFSAPMREIVGVLSMHLCCGSPVDDDVLRRAIEVANRAKSVQSKLSKQAMALALDHFFGEASGEPEREYCGTIMGATERKLYLQLDEPPVDVKLYAPDIERWLGPLRPQSSGVSIDTRASERSLSGTDSRSSWIHTTTSATAGFSARSAWATSDLEQVFVG